VLLWLVACSIWLHLCTAGSPGHSALAVRNRLDATPDFSAFQEKARHLLDEQRDPARTLGDAIDHVLRQSMPSSDLADHCRT
jgi:hypothetical protein